jgi:hypothetical protein
LFNRTGRSKQTLEIGNTTLTCIEVDITPFINLGTNRQ